MLIKLTLINTSTLHHIICYPYHFTLSIPCSQALRITWICLGNVSFDLRCDELEEWLIKIYYSPTLIRKQIIKARAVSRDISLDRVKEVKNNDILAITLTYHPSIKNFQNVLNEAHILLTPSKEHRKVFGDKTPVIGWRKLKSRKDHVLSTKVKCEPYSDNESNPCCWSGCQICSFIEETKTFQTMIKVKYFALTKGF